MRVAPARSRHPGLLIPALMLAGGLALTAATTYLVSLDVREDARLRFDRLAERLGAVVTTRMVQPRYGLRGAAGVYAASESVSRDEFRAYVESRDLRTEFPGALGFGFIERVARADLATFLERERRDHAPEFSVRTEGDAPELYVIKYIEPLAKNRAAWGFDIGSEPRRRAAAEAAARTGLPTLTPALVLLQDVQKGPGFLLLTPIYAKGPAPRTEAERLARLVGFVYAPLLASELFAGATRETEGMVDLEIFDGPETRLSNLIYDDDRHLAGGDDRVDEADYRGRTFQKALPLEAGGRLWTARLSSTARFDATIDHARTRTVAIAGIALSLLLALCGWALTRSRARAVVLAQEMTASLRASEAEARKLALVASRTDNAVIVADRDGRIEWVNDGFVRIAGWTLDEVRGRRPGEFLQGPETDPATVAEMRAALAAGRGFNVEVVNYHKSGRPYWIAVEVQVLRDADGRVTQFMAIESDVTARRRAEADLREAMAEAQRNAVAAERNAEEARRNAEEAQRANVAKSQFLATMSHEIRTPMNGVIGMTSLLLDTPLDAQQREYTEVIRNSGEALLSVINDILDFSKIESGHLELENEVFEVRGCVEAVLDVVAPAAAAKGLDLLYEVDDAVPAALRGDVTRLRQVILNLAGNAVKFTERGEVEVTVRALAAASGMHRLEIAVRDTGIGIPEEARSRLFRSFSQVDASTTRKYGGTGLGLAISRRLVELMGGTLEVDSAPGRGSTFRFTIELAAAPAREAAEDPNPDALRGRRLLVVDDNATSRRILAGMAAKWGVHAVTAASAAEGLAQVRESPPFDAVISDMEMPGADGVEFARRLRAEHGAGAPPVVLLSSLGRREATDEPGLFAAMLAKPARHGQILATLVAVIDAARARACAASSAASPSAAAAGDAPLRTERVLLAEDNAVNQKVALHMLKRLGYRADVAANGREALEAVNRQRYDVVLMDMQMPEMDGLEATRRIVAQWPDRASRPWIVALTANAMAGDMEACLLAGMDDFVTKPVTMAALAAALARVHGGAAAARRKPAGDTAVAG